MAYGNPNEVEMLDLETGKTSSWTDKPAMADLKTFFLSDRYLVLVWGNRYDFFCFVLFSLGRCRLTGALQTSDSVGYTHIGETSSNA